MFRFLSELIFKTSEIESNLFGMADDVYNTIEIFEEAARFETKIARPYKMISSFLDCLVFMVVALMLVGFIMHDRIVVFRNLARIGTRKSQRAAVRTNRSRQPRRSLDSLLPENDNENVEKPAEEDDNSVGNCGNETDGEDNATLRPQDHKHYAMIGTPKWALNWLTTLRNKSFGSFYDGLFR
ncbi:uncharacterized protein LOC108025233 [Drosophila biarmipes]|uniref:uncharacterized protein LOC108025233 n=1 Tax=Drosophila biarmipes TaxID=125945 RepID=UPI0007E88760|nr:uncharacterized protein LOC108025233 [Drosophila biarmipes]